MHSFSADALVLRAADRGASDTLLTLISAEGGRFFAILKGSHSTKHREVAATEPYTWSNMEFYERGGIKWVKSATTIESFGGIRYDAEKLFLAAYFADVVIELSDERTSAGEILPLYLNTLHMLSTTKGEDVRIKAAFEMRAAVIAGFCPALAVCGECGASIGEGDWLDVMNGSIICRDCLAKKSTMGALPEVDAFGERTVLCPLTASAAAALSFVVTSDAKRIFSFRLTDEHSLSLFSKAAEAYLLHHLERGFPSLENYKRLLALREQMISPKQEKTQQNA